MGKMRCPLQVRDLDECGYRLPPVLQYRTNLQVCQQVSAFLLEKQFFRQK
jgi:hypothetical protein